MIEEKSWFAIEVTVVSEASEAIEFGLNELDALGTEINNLGKKPTETLCVIGYFNEILNLEIVRNQSIGYSNGKNIGSQLKLKNLSSRRPGKKLTTPTK